MMAAPVDRQEESDMSRTVRTIALAAVLVLTAASAAQASPPSAASIWDWVASWIMPAGMRPIWENEGCQMDPDGRPCGAAERRLEVPARRGLTPVWERAGCQMDPDGNCAASETAEKDTSADRSNLVRRVRN
jgi:hypothetical protein